MKAPRALVFNADDAPAGFVLPSPPEGSSWQVLFDTAGTMVAGAAPFVIPPAVRGRLLSKSVQKSLIPKYGPTVANRLQAALLENSPVGLTALGLQALGE